VVLNGKPIGNQSAYQYFRTEGREELRAEVNAAFDRLAARFNPVVMEGAGSVSEINLREMDLVNMPMAMHADASVILVADIDRGGVFASVYGSVMLMTEEERKHIKGILINKFRGDIRLFESGVKILEDLCQIPVLGVVPYYKDIHIEEEDSVALHTKQIQASHGKVNVVVVLLRHMSNFTDFNMLEQDPRVHLYYSSNVDEIEKADIILLPGSKNTLDDLYDLRRNGVAQSILKAHRNGATVVGICGGFQMMGQEICDPDHVEGDIERLPGLGLLPVSTKMLGEKVTRQVKFTFRNEPGECSGYEIHMGITTPVSESEPSVVNHLQDGTVDGFYINEKCFGTYIHGVLDNSVVIDHLLLPYRSKLTEKPFDYCSFKEEQYNLLADHVRAHVDMDLMYKIIS
jgi:adenosylcobyric acid synthase